MDKKRKDKITQNLEHHIKNVDSIDSFFDIHSSSILEDTPGEYLDSLIMQKGIKRGELLRLMNMSKSFFYEVLRCSKLPGRDSFLQFLLALSLSFTETQIALKSCGYKPLYARNRWDAIIIYGIENKLSLIDTNILLDSQNMDILC